MKKVIALLLIVSPFTSCDWRSDRVSTPQERKIADLTDVCHDPLWRSISPRGLISPRACPVVSHPFKQIYHSTFPSPGCCLVDLLPDAPKGLAEGKSHEEKAASGDKNSGALTLTAPAKIDTDPADPELTKTPSVGFFRSGVNFGSKAVFSVRATFRAPKGPFDDKAWAAVVTVRDGGELDDLYNAKRISVTLRFKLGGAMLNVGAGADATTKPPAIDIGPTLYGLIVRDEQPFTLDLYVDRNSGEGTASLVKGGSVVSVLRFDLDKPLKDPGFVFTTAGAALADCCVPNADVSVQVTDFQIWSLTP